MFGITTFQIELEISTTDNNHTWSCNRITTASPKALAEELAAKVYPDQSYLILREKSPYFWGNSFYENAKYLSVQKRGEAHWYVALRKPQSPFMPNGAKRLIYTPHLFRPIQRLSNESGMAFYRGGRVYHS